jgi:hypothetical protein
MLAEGEQEHGATFLAGEWLAVAARKIFLLVDKSFSTVPVLSYGKETIYAQAVMLNFIQRICVWNRNSGTATFSVVGILILIGAKGR